jgi:hypothetical protein
MFSFFEVCVDHLAQSVRNVLLATWVSGHIVGYMVNNTIKYYHLVVLWVFLVVVHNGLFVLELNSVFLRHYYNIMIMGSLIQ